MGSSLGVVITTYERPAWVERCVASIARYARPERIVVVDQSLVEAWSAPQGLRLTVIRCEPGFPGPRRRRGAAELDTDLVLFLDDDCELLSAFAEDREEILRSAVDAEVGLVSLPLRGARPREPRGPVGMSGGMLLRRQAYWAVGGHGADYLDDVDLALRVRWAGLRILRHRRQVSVHHYGVRGGLRMLRGSSRSETPFGGCRGSTSSIPVG